MNAENGGNNDKFIRDDNSQRDICWIGTQDGGFILDLRAYTKNLR